MWLLLLSLGCRSRAPCADCSIVWITVDTLRQDRVGSHKGLTPNIDALALKGSQWRQTMAPGPATIYSVPAYLSGRHRHNTGMNFDLQAKADYHPLSDEVVTLAEVLRDQGIEGWAHNANRLISGQGVSDFNLGQGFDNWDLVSDEEVAALGIERLQQNKRQFLYLHFMGPHTDNPQTAGFEDRRGTFDSRLTALGGATAGLYSALRSGRIEPTEGDRQYIGALYDDAVWQVDRLVGTVLDTIDLERTLVVITSDHGENLGERRDRRVWGHGGNLYDELLKVPLVLAGPGVPVQVDDQHPVSLVDLAPTLTRLVDIPVDPDWLWDGQDMLNPSPRPIYAERNGALGRQGAIRDGWHKLQMIEDRPGSAKRFDLQHDPREAHPVPVNHQEDGLIAVRQQAWDQARGPAAQSLDPSTEEIEQIRALGYLE